MTGRELAVRDERNDAVREFEKSQRISYCGTGFTDALRRLVLSQREGVHERLYALRLFNRVEILALEVFYKSESHRLVVAELFYNNGDFGQTRHARCAPAAFAGDELIAAVWHRAHEKRLNDAVFRYAVRKLGERILVKYFSRLVAVGLDIHYLELDRAGRGYLFNGVVGKQSVKPAAESAFFAAIYISPFGSVAFLSVHSQELVRKVVICARSL